MGRSRAWLVAAGAVISVTLLSVWADWRFADQPRLPIRFGTDGSIGSTAPRRIALALIPIFAGAGLVSSVVMRSYDRDTGKALRDAVLIGGLMVVGQLVYLYLLVRHVVVG